MSTPKKPAGRQARPRLPAAAAGAPAFELTRDEMHLILQYRATQFAKRSAIITVAESFVRNFPRYTRPMLRVVTGGSS